MHRLIRVSALAALALALTIGTSSAATMRWGGQAFGGFNTFSMSDWNDIIDNANSTGTSYDNITSGYSFGIGPSVIVNDRWQFGAHFEKLMPKKSSDGSTGIEIKLGANAFGVSGAYLFPSTGPFSVGLGVSVDEIQLTGELTGGSMTASEEGSGIGFLLGGMGSYALSPMVSGDLSIGYRIADISVDKLGGEDPEPLGLSSEDYSGVAIRVGLSFHQAKK